MRTIRVGMMSLSLGLLLLGADAVAQNREARKQKKEDGGQASQQQQQTVRGKVAGVTTVGEAVIDPATNTAVVVSADYLTILGTSVGRKGAKAAKPEGRRGGETAAGGSRDNLYLVAITPETTVREGRRGSRDSAGKGKDKPDQAASKAAFDKLEIGDQVVVQVAGTDRLRQQGGSTERAQYRPDTSSDSNKMKKHGKHRIMIGEASSVTILPAPTASGRNQESDESRNR